MTNLHKTIEHVSSGLKVRTQPAQSFFIIFLILFKQIVCIILLKLSSILLIKAVVRLHVQRISKTATQNCISPILPS